MADEDEIDVLGDFSFDSCLAQNNQGIPSCSDREDTVHPQWFLDSTANNWYDSKSNPKASKSDGPSRILSGNKRMPRYNVITNTSWSVQERKVLVREMSKYGRNFKKISQAINSKTEAEIRALIEAEFGVHLDTPSVDLNRTHDDIPAVIEEEIVTEDNSSLNGVLSMVTTAAPTVLQIPFKKKNLNNKNSLLKPEVLKGLMKTPDMMINPNEILYDDDMVIGSTELIGDDTETVNIVAKKLAKNRKIDAAKTNFPRKIGNHRRKVSRNYDKSPKHRNSSKDNLRSPQNRQRKDSGLAEDSTKSPKLQIVLGSGQALPVSEGEQVIKIEKKKDSDSESDIDIDVDSDVERPVTKKKEVKEEVKPVDEAPIAVPLRKFEPMSRRQKKINLDGEGGYTIIHTDSGDLYAIGAEPKKERHPKKQPINLIQCRVYNSDRPAPFQVSANISALLCVDAHAHCSRAEVMGLVGGGGGSGGGGGVVLAAYCPAAARGGATHCDMDPVSQAQSAETLRARGYSVVGWHHSHPTFPPSPSLLDLSSQRSLQQLLESSRGPFLGLISSQHWPTGRTASQFKCIRVEETEPDLESGFQLNMKLIPDVTTDSAPDLLSQIKDILKGADVQGELAVDLCKDVCPQAGITYLEKLISSVSHHMRSAGYSPEDPVIEVIVKGIRDIFR